MANTEVSIKKALVSEGANYSWTSDKITPENGIFTFRDYLDGLDNNMQILREYSYSYDKKKWSPLYEWPRYPFNTTIDLTKAFYLKFRWTLQANILGDTLIISKVSYTEKLLQLDQVKLPDSLPFIDQMKPVDFYGPGQIAAQNQQALDFWINKNRGLDVYYWNITADEGQIDTILNEISQSDTKPKKCIKVYLENNEIPTDEIQFDEWAANFQQFEVSINKMYFESVFGKNVKPRDGDFLYLIKANRLYTIQSTFLARGADQQSTNHVLCLKTFEDDAAVRKDDETELFLEERTLNHEKYFEEDNVNEMIDSLNVQQNNKATISRDPLRQEVDQNIDIVTDPTFWNKGIELIPTWYDLSKISPEDAGVVYHPQIEMIVDGEICFASWVKIGSSEIATTAVSAEFIGDTTKLIIKDTTKMLAGDYIVDNATGKIYEMTTVESGYVIIPGNITFTNGIKVYKYQPLYFVQADTNSPISAGFISNKKIKIKFAGGEQIHDLSFIPADWMSVVINISNKFKYIGAYFWKVNTTSTTSTRLQLLQKSEKENSTAVIFTDSQVIIPGTTALLSNIRVYKLAMGYDHQSNMQSTRVVPKPSMAYIIDDVKEIYNVFNVGDGAQVKNNPKKK